MEILAALMVSLFYLLPVLWLIATFIVAHAASQRNRSAVAWWLVAFFYSPPLAALFLIAFPDQPKEIAIAGAGHNKVGNINVVDDYRTADVSGKSSSGSGFNTVAFILVALFAVIVVASMVAK
jgi:ABC-type glycerol-3-phosphate transport system permease component